MKTIHKDRAKILLSRIISKAQAKLHTTPSSLVLLEYKVTDANGIDLYEIKGKSNSFVRGYHHMMALQTTLQSEPKNSVYPASLGYKNTSGTVIYGERVGIGAPSASGNSFGILVGTNSAEEDFESYALGTLILNGTTSGKLSYGAQTTDLVYSDLVWTHTVIRPITNLSGGDITINEVGLVVYAADGTLTNIPALIIRDKLSTPITLTNGQTVTFTYTFNYTMPE